MSTRNHDFKRHRLSGCKSNSGYFVPNGTSNPTTLGGRGFTVTYQATGIWKVTFDGPYRSIVNLLAMPMGTTNPALCQCDSIVEGASNAASFFVRCFEQDPADQLLKASNGASRIFFSADFDDQGAHLWPHRRAA
jgi:hypothetical protein